MKELFSSLPVLESNMQAEFLVDTCFLYYTFEHQHEKEFTNFCKNHVVAISSFNQEEFLFHSHDVNHNIREHFRHFVKNGGRLYTTLVPVSPGNPAAEKEYVNATDTRLLEIIPDPSDAVLFAAALKLKASVLTRDKHHLFTAALENFAVEHNMHVLNNFPE